jgi:transposase-like protein
MARKYANYSAETKLELAVQAIGCQKTINKIASENQIPPPSQVAEWKKTLQTKGLELFRRRQKRASSSECVFVECLQ